MIKKSYEFVIEYVQKVLGLGAVTTMREKTMKKILGVSVAAMLAVTPMMANAQKTASEADVIQNITTDVNMATTSYVQGAYNVLAGKHNQIITDITVPTKQEGNYNSITTTNSVAENLVALDSAISTLNGASSTYQLAANSEVSSGMEADDASGNHITSGNNVGANLESLNAAVKANDTAIANHTTAIGAANGTAFQTAMTGKNYISGATNVTGALGTLDTTVKTQENTIGAADSTALTSALTGTNAGSATTVVGAMNALDTAIEGLRTDAGTNYQAKSDSTVVASDLDSTTGVTNHITEGASVHTNLGTLNAAVIANDAAIATNTTNISTNTSNISTINNKQIPVVQTWTGGANDVVVNKKISDLVTYQGA